VVPVSVICLFSLYDFIWHYFIGRQQRHIPALNSVSIIYICIVKSCITERKRKSRKTYSTEVVETDASARPPKCNFCIVWPWPWTFWPPKLTVSCHCSVDHLCRFASKSIRPSVHHQMDGQTDEQADGQTGRKHYSSRQSSLAEALGRGSGHHKLEVCMGMKFPMGNWIRIVMGMGIGTQQHENGNS